MREHIHQLVFNALRVTRMEPAQQFANSNPLRSQPSGCDMADLSAAAVRMARVATAIHMDQASRLRVRMASHRNAQQTIASAVTETLS